MPQDASQSESPTLDLQPIGSSIAETAARLVLGHTVGIHLEPGDRTSYRFLLAPCWVDMIMPATGGSIGDGSDYIFVAPLSCRAYPIHRGSDAGYLESKTGAGTSTASIISEFLSLLWIEIDALSQEAPSQIVTLAGEG